MSWKERWVGPENPKIILVQPPLSKRYQAIETTFAPAPPTWAAILAGETRRRSGDPESDFQIFYTPQAELSQFFYKQCAEADILGITDWFSCHESTLEIAAQVKKINPELLVILGGINAGNLAPQILKNHPYIDLVVLKDGEDVLWRILQGQRFKQIPNLWSRDTSGTPQFSHHKMIDLNEISLWNFEGLVNETILVEYKKSLNQSPHTTVPLGVSLTRGCQKCQQKKPCTYCTAWGKYRETDPQKAIGQLRFLEKSGFRYLFETGDDFSNLRYLQQLVNLRKPSDNFKIRCYANPATITMETAVTMAKLGIYEVFLGFETADNEIAARANRTTTLVKIENAIQNLQRVNVSVCLPIMFGLPGENTSTIEETSTHTKLLINKYNNIRMVLISLAIPLAGSLWFKQLTSNSKVVAEYNTAGDLMNEDEFDYFRLLELSLKLEGTKISDIVKIVRKLKEDLKNQVIIGSFGAIEIS